jgi:hypothetical protein
MHPVGLILIIISMYVFLHLIQVTKADIFEILSEKILFKSVPAPNSICILWTGNVTSNRLYGLLSYRDPETNIWKKKHVHRLAFTIKMRSVNISKELDASHLCHNSLCVWMRITSAWHPIISTTNRQYCIGYGNYFGHGEFPNCMLQLKLWYGKITGIMICPETHPPTYIHIEMYISMTWLACWLHG